jgi:hypothetical protein
MNTPIVFDIDDLCDDFDPFEELLALHADYPNLKVTLFAIPGRCDLMTVNKYLNLDYVEVAMHGYHHSSIECAVWTEEETIDKVTEAALKFPKMVKGFKAPGWTANHHVYRGLEKIGYWTAVHDGHMPEWRWWPGEMYCYNGPMNPYRAAHGHTWETCDNGPSKWREMLEKVEVTPDDEFLFVSEAVLPRSSLHKVALEPGACVLDLGAFSGEEIYVARKAGATIHAFEPHPKMFERLEEVWSGDVGVTLDLERFAAEAIDIGDYVNNMDRDVDVLKMNVEGAEYVIIERLLDSGAYKRIGRWLVEDHERKMDAEWTMKKKLVLDRCEELGVELEEWPL